MTIFLPNFKCLTLSLPVLCSILLHIDNHVLNSETSACNYPIIVHNCYHDLWLRRLCKPTTLAFHNTDPTMPFDHRGATAVMSVTYNQHETRCHNVNISSTALCCCLLLKARDRHNEVYSNSLTDILSACL